MFLLIFSLHLCFNHYNILFSFKWGIFYVRKLRSYFRKWYAHAHSLYNAAFDHIRSQMHDYFELSMIVSGNCTLQLDDHIYNLTEDDVFCVNPLSLHELHGVNCVIVTVLFNQICLNRFYPFHSILAFSLSVRWPIIRKLLSNSALW